MVSIALPQSGRARSAARHRERTEGRPLTRRPQTTTRTSSSMNGTAAGATAVNSNYPLASRDPGLIRRGNETIRAAIRTQGLQLVPFFCECSDATLRAGALDTTRRLRRTHSDRCKDSGRGHAG